MRIVTLDEALASGRRFRKKEASNHPASHRLKTNHIWRMQSDVPPTSVSISAGNRNDVLLACAECAEGVLTIPINTMDEWIIEHSDEELEQESLRIINALGLNMEEEALA